MQTILEHSLSTICALFFILELALMYLCLPDRPAVFLYAKRGTLVPSVACTRLYETLFIYFFVIRDTRIE